MSWKGPHCPQVTSGFQRAVGQAGAQILTVNSSQGVWVWNQMDFSAPYPGLRRKGCLRFVLCL